MRLDQMHGGAIGTPFDPWIMSSRRGTSQSTPE